MTYFEYLVVAVQEGRATWANGAFLGTAPVTEDGALDSCPDLSVYLNERGREGWELCSVDSTPPVGVRDSSPWLTKAYLKRSS